MNRQEIEQHVRSVARTCRGPGSEPTAAAVVGRIAIHAERARDAARVAAERAALYKPDEPDYGPLADRAQAVAKEAAAFDWFTEAEEARLLSLGTREAALTALLEAGRRELASAADQETRQGCGFDFNETILANPLDGKLHPYRCPRCGVAGEYRAPLFEADAPSAAAEASAPSA